MNILHELYLSRKNAMIYFNHEDHSSFQYGTVIAENNAEVGLHMISPNGYDDGILGLSIDRILRIDVGGQYEEKMKKLCALQSPLPEVEIDGKNIFSSILTLSLKNKEVVSIELCGSELNDVVGIIENVIGTQYTIRLIDEYGFEDGFSYIDLQDITKIILSSENEKRILALWKATNNQPFHIS